MPLVVARLACGNLLLQGLLWLVGFPVQARASRSIVVPGIGHMWRLLEIHHAAAFARFKQRVRSLRVRRGTRANDFGWRFADHVPVFGC